MQDKSEEIALLVGDRESEVNIQINNTVTFLLRYKYNEGIFYPWDH